MSTTGALTAATLPGLCAVASLRIAIDAAHHAQASPSPIRNGHLDHCPVFAPGVDLHVATSVGITLDIPHHFNSRA